MSDISYSYPTQSYRANAQGACNNSQVCSSDELANKDKSFGFKDILDTINPLQQIPIVSTLYRAATGDTISATARMAGGALFGGPIGFMASAINAGLDAASGTDIGGHLLGWLGEGSTETTTANATEKYSLASKLE